MKIGILTTHMADNYGAVLQAYGLSAYLGERADCEILHYYPAYTEAAYRGKEPIHNLRALVRALYFWLYAKERRRRSRRFAAFRKQYMRLSPLCRTGEELAAIAGEYDVLVAGSDQIWNPELHGFDETYFLPFAPKWVRKTGYAPSFGVASLTDEQAAQVRKRCAGFSRLAFREESGVRLAREVLERECPLVLDPVFLLSAAHWRTLKSSKAPRGKYVLCCFLSAPRGSVRAMCRRFKKEGYAVYSIGFSVMDMLNGAKKIYDLGPAEFLAYMDGADYVLTDSFHVTAFSLLFGKNFYTRVDGQNAKRADRVLTLLRAAGAEERAYADAQAAELPFSPLDATAVSAALASAIAASRRYADELLEE